MTMMDLNKCEAAMVLDLETDWAWNVKFFADARSKMEEAGIKVDFYEFKGDLKEEIEDLCQFYDFVVPSPQNLYLTPIRKRLEFLYVSQ